LEPGVFGIIKPVLLLPEGVTDRLSQAELQTVIAHELCHVQRRDNLTASIHMLVEAVFWFHPLVWWIKFRLIDEQERACDEAVLRGGGDPKTYAESILKICECYLTSPSMCVSGITSSNLRKRIEAIMRNRVGLELSSSRKLLLVGAAIAVLAAPFLVGIANAKASEGRPEPTTTTLMPSPQGGQRGGASVPQGFVVGEIRVIGAKVISDDFVRQTLGLVPGETYDESRLGKGFGNLTRFYGAAGYVNFLPQPTFQLDEQRRVVNLTINIDEGVRYFVARIGFAGNTSASDDVLRRELSLKEGLPFNAALMEPAIARLNQLGLFEEIRIEDFMVAPYPNEPKVDVFLKVTDKKR
jgi:outer membrane protein assembly factor BamA